MLRLFIVFIACPTIEFMSVVLTCFCGAQGNNGIAYHLCKDYIIADDKNKEAMKFAA